MHHSAEKVAIALRRTAALLDEHGANTERTIADWAAGGTSSSGGPGQVNAISDPTGNAATGEPDPLAGLWARWQRNKAALVMWGGLVGEREPAARLRYHADRADTPPKYRQELLSGLWAICCEFDHIIYEALPMDREAANELLAEERYLALPKDCLACESPTPELRSGYCDGCRKRRTRFDELHPGEEFDTNAFKAWIVADIAAGLISRPASPYSPIGRQWVAEDTGGAA